MWKRSRTAIKIAVGFALFCGPALADACRDEIAALWDGPMDPFQRPPHRQEVQVLDADGNELRLMSNTIETPMRTISGQLSANHFTMAIDRDIWNGPSPDGPWTNMDMQMPEGRADSMRRAMAEQRANLTDTVCHGPGEGGLIRYTFRTQTSPDATGAFFGSLDTVTLDPESGQIVRFEMTDFVNPWTEGVSKERHDIEVIFDPSIKVVAPE